MANVSLALRALPIVERWDCHNCGICCRGSVITLDESDLDRLRQQDWQSRPELRGQRITVRRSTFSTRRQLAKRPDGSCIFLHAWGAAAGATVGCTAMELSELERLLVWLDAASAPVLVQLPEPVYRQLARRWGLPALD